jgi:chromosomal replication initiation ATPase DnaA
MNAQTFWRGEPDLRPVPVTMRELLAEVAQAHGLSVAELKGRNRTRPVAVARQLFIARAYATGRYSLPQIGRFLKRHHTTILHGVRAHAAKTGWRPIGTRSQGFPRFP